jgi:biopolymer transport protein ExbB
MSLNSLRLFCCWLLIAGSLPALADHPTDLDHLLRQVKQASERESTVRREREAQFLSEKADRQAMLNEVREQVELQRRRGEDLKQQFADNETALQTLNEELATKTGNLGELFGTVRQSANDLHALLQDSLVSAQFPGRAEWFDVLGKSKKLPNVTELERFWLLMQQEIEQSGEVSRFQAPVTDATGITQTEPVIRIGVFTVISGNRFLRYLPDTGRLISLPRQPARPKRKQAAAFGAQQSGYAPILIDPTRGGLLGLIVQTPTLPERIQQGGAVGYIIIGIGLLGMLLVILRLIYLSWVGQRIKRQLREPDAPLDDNPLGRILLAAGNARDRDIDATELLLDEAILRETPVLQRGLGLIKLLAAVAPLLGLLGTVTGMILTFQSISLFGTGDPKLMAGGISQALITTVMGLVTAIPLLFFHTLLASRSRTLIQILDEQSAGVVAQRVNHHD